MPSGLWVATKSAPSPTTAHPVPIGCWTSGTGRAKSYRLAGSTAPAGTLLCYGQAISRTDYVGLFTVIGTTYGVGDGTTTFNVPDLRGTVPAGKTNMGGSIAATYSAARRSVLRWARSLAQANTSQPDSAASVDFDAPDANVAPQFHVHSFTYSTVQPTIILNYIIRI